MITLVWRTDVHLAVGSPQSRTDDWAATVLGKVRQVGEIAREVGADAVLDGGDFFHVKTPSRTTHEQIIQVAQEHAKYPCPVYGNVGNHDVKYGDLRFLKEAPLGVLFEMGIFQRCYDEHEHLFHTLHPQAPGFGDRLVDPKGIKVRVVGVPYHGTTYDMDRLTSIVKGDEDYLVVMAHLLASPSGGSMFGGEDIVKYQDIVNLDPDVYCFGHWHKNQGVHKSGHTHIVNVGSLTRGALTEDEMERVPEVVIIRFTKDGIDIEQRPLVVQPAKDVFDLVGRVRQEAQSMTVDGFVESMKASMKVGGGQPLLEAVADLGLPDPVRERLVLYLEEQGVS